jgi:bifunctional non-homologous end joining protein LigD
MSLGRYGIEEKINSGIASGHITFILEGRKLKGEFALLMLKKIKEDNAWLLIKKDDEFTSDVDVAKNDRSVLTGRSMTEIKVQKI